MRLTDFTGARRVPLVGRRDLLLEAERRIGRGGVHLVYVEGEGGIGKTALLEGILEQSQRGSRADTMPACLVAQEAVDLSHMDVYTSEGLIRRIVDILGKWSFTETLEVLDAIDQARVTGDMEAASHHALTLRTTFLSEFLPLTDHGLVLAFDTVEVLAHERDPFQEDLEAELPILGAGDWLLRSFLPALRGNVVVLLAGRPSDLLGRLEALKELNAQLLLRHIQLEGLGEDECRQYLKAVAQVQGRWADADAATRLWLLAEERADVIHHLTGGRPIWLALLADLVTQNWPLPDLFDRDLEALHERPAGDWQPLVQAGLIQRLQESATPMADTLRALAWLPRGATPQLLARIMDLRTERGEWDIYTATGYLDQVAQLALVRVRSGDRRVFLHDQMYSLLGPFPWGQGSDEERDRRSEAIRHQYRSLTRDLEQRAERIPPALASVQSHLRQALVEEMHYRLRHDPPMGFAMYFWLAEEALAGRDVEMDMLVRTEFLRTLTSLEQSDHFLGAVPREAEVDTAVRWGARALVLLNDPEAALFIFDQVRRRWGREAGKLGLAWTHLQLYRAAALIQRAVADDWEEARELLAGVERSADEVLASPPENAVVKSRRWRARVLKSLALGFRGYVDRQEGRYLEAARHYQESALLQRRLGMSALVPTLANLAHVMALTGECRHARLLAEEAEGLAHRKGLAHQLASILNVRAIVEGHDGHHKVALRYADRALQLAQTLPNARLRGLIHLTRARSLRHLLHALTEDERKRDLHYFEPALKDANEAVGHLRGAPLDRVDALLERGALHRDLARLHRLDDRSKEAELFAQKGRSDLERAAVLAAAIDLPSQQALAWTNVGWLCYYTGETEAVPEALKKAYSPFPKDYLFNGGGSLPLMAKDGRKNQASLPYWGTLGKAEMLQAYLALDRARGADSDADHAQQLQAAVKHITLSLAYDELISDSYDDLARAEENLHRRILQEGLDISTVHRYTQQVAEAQGLQQPTRFQAFLTRMFGPAELWS